MKIKLVALAVILMAQVGYCAKETVVTCDMCSQVVQSDTGYYRINVVARNVTSDTLWPLTYLCGVCIEPIEEALGYETEE